MNGKDCYFCKKQHTRDCPNSYYCYETKNKPYFEVNNKKYKSRLICGDKEYYNIHHFNKFQKWLGKIIFKIKIEDVIEEE